MRNRGQLPSCGKARLTESALENGSNRGNQGRTARQEHPVDRVRPEPGILHRLIHRGFDTGDIRRDPAHFGGLAGEPFMIAIMRPMAAGSTAARLSRASSSMVRRLRIKASRDQSAKSAKWLRGISSSLSNER